YIDGYSFPRFFVKIFVPLIGSGIGVTAFFCFMFSWVELLLARTLAPVDAKPIVSVMTRTVSASGIDWGVLAAAGVLTILPGMLVIWFVRNNVAKGIALGRELESSIRGMGWARPAALFFGVVAGWRAASTACALCLPFVPRRGILPLVTTGGER